MSDSTIRIGPAGWSYEDWKGVVYPPQMPKSLHPLTYIAQYFDTVEINNTFYRPPLAKYCASWVKKAEANPRFKFTMKLWQRFTHERDAFPSDDEIAQYRDGVQPMVDAGKLGAVLVQFPWSFKRTPEERVWLARVLDTFQDLPLALEIRHASWNRPEVYDELARRQVSFCNIDQPLFSKSIAPSARVTARVGYVRLHGRNAKDWFRESAGRDERYDYLYSKEELGEWVQKIERIRKMASEIYVITNNHYRGQAVVNAFELRHDLENAPQAPPQQIIDAYPQLARVLPQNPGPALAP